MLFVLIIILKLNFLTSQLNGVMKETEESQKIICLDLIIWRGGFVPTTNVDVTSIKPKLRIERMIEDVPKEPKVLPGWLR
ncbi:Hypothetical protein HVR_LOCUS1247 [uncultured virus]|nr:Hypothetical protein HVR_LOCUS1247 [uncultured virus]